MYKVIIATDHLGERVLLLRSDEGLFGGPGIRFRLALETDEYGEAACAAELIRQRLSAEQRPVPESTWQELERAAIAPDEPTRTGQH